MIEAANADANAMLTQCRRIAFADAFADADADADADAETEAA